MGDLERHDKYGSLRVILVGAGYLRHDEQGAMAGDGTASRGIEGNTAHELLDSTRVAIRWVMVLSVRATKQQWMVRQRTKQSGALNWSVHVDELFTYFDNQLVRG